MKHTFTLLPKENRTKSFPFGNKNKIIINNDSKIHLLIVFTNANGKELKSPLLSGERLNTLVENYFHIHIEYNELKDKIKIKAIFK